MGGVPWKMKNEMKRGREHCREGEHYGVVRRCGGRRASWTRGSSMTGTHGRALLGQEVTEEETGVPFSYLKT